MNRVGNFGIPLLAATGAGFCLANALGWHLPCGTAGCEVYAGFTLFGYSLYVWGVIGFAALALSALVLSATGRERPYGFLLAGALLADTCCLFYQSLFGPCGNCLLVAAMVGGTAVLSMAIHSRFRNRLIFGLTCLWTLFFVNVGISFTKETIFKPWAVVSPPDSTIQVYFSPTCPACREAVEQVLLSPVGKEAAFYPIAKNSEDRVRIQCVLNEGLKGEQALRRLFEKNESVGREAGFDLRLKLLRNKVALVSRGFNRVPLIITPFVPTAPGQSGADPGGQSVGVSPAYVLPPPEGCSMVTEEACR
jgi:hypothetical protein